MADELVPTFSDLACVYAANLPAAIARYETLRSAFTERFGNPPQFWARAPGRVNLVGEHIDYEGYGVLPMAVELDTVVAIRKGGDSVVITNLDQQKYPDTVFGTDPAQRVDVANHSWANYFLAAYKGVFEHLSSKGVSAEPVGLKVMVHGTVPTGSGLSSSSAFVCSSALALLAIYDCAESKAAVAEFACTCERHVGTESGGMDQAISMMAMRGVAKHIEFHPVRCSNVYLPDDATFVIANSLTESKKAETGATKYNLRVVECQLAAMVLAVLAGESQEHAITISTLSEVESIISAKPSGKDDDDHGSCSAAVQAMLHEGAYDQGEIEHILGITLDQLYADNASALRVLPGAAGAGAYQLRKRAMHVFQEAARVLHFRDICNSQQPPADKLAKLGQLLDDSHASCSDLYNCSSPELDALVAISKQTGAIGSRLTGAGWGGCTVSLVRTADVDHFISQVESKYFAPLVQAGKLLEKDMGTVIFASKPASGAAVLVL